MNQLQFFTNAQNVDMNGGKDKTFIIIYKYFLLYLFKYKYI